MSKRRGRSDRGGDTDGSIQCQCLNPAFKYLEKKLINKKNIAKHLKMRKPDKRQHSEPVSVMYTGGTIRTLKGGKVDTTVESIGFHGGKVVAAGSKEEVMAAMDGLGVNYTAVKLADGQTLLPGFVDTHVHIILTAMFTTTWNDFGPFDGQYVHEKYDSSFVKDGIEEAKKTLPKGYWILAQGVDPSLMPFTIVDDGLNVFEHFNVDNVDAIENEVPVFMSSFSGHTGYVNTKALREIYESVKPPEFDTFEKFREHVNSRGGLQELEEILPALSAIPEDQEHEIILNLFSGLDHLFEQAARHGVTLMYDAGMTPESKEVLDFYFASSSTQKSRVGYGIMVNSLAEAQEVESWEPVTDIDKMYEGAIKIVSDGSNPGLTGYQYEPYRCEPPNNTGIFNFSVDDFNEMVKILIDKGWPLMIHANGEKAVDQTLTAYSKALNGESGLLKRHRIEHCSLANDDALRKMSELGISPSFFVSHVGYWGYVFGKGLFEEKAQLTVRSQSALSKGIRISLHSDHFVTPLGCLRMMEQAITRIMERDPQNGVIVEDEKITPAQALRAVSYDAAWQCQADQWVGSLEEGKMADYVILGEDPITRKDPVGMRNIPILETWVGGVRTFFSKVTPV